MRTLMILAVAAGCGAGPSTSDTMKVFATSTNALDAARTRAIIDARTTQTTPSLAIDYRGACDRGGTIALRGKLDDSAIADHTAFDLDVALASCTTYDENNDRISVLDGALAWTATVDGTAVTTTLEGELDYADPSGAWSCGVDEVTHVDATLRFVGTLCGYAMHDDLKLGY